MPDLPRRGPTFGLAAIVVVLVSGCGDSVADAASAGPPPPEVAVVTVAPHDVPRTDELPGRVTASRVAEVRARATGIVLSRAFVEGSDVAAGDVLFRIDDAPMQAEVARTLAARARARAVAGQARARAQRFDQLIANHAVSQLEHDDAIAAREQADADVAVAEAALQTARLDLDYATVTAPIAGRIGRAMVTEGALVDRTQGTLLATIQQLDPVYVDLTQSVAQVQALRAAVAAGTVDGAGEGAPVTLVRADGSTYGHPGRLLFTDVSVDEATGSVTLRAEVPNPDGDLLPGEFVRARVDQGVVPGAMTVPQQAVSLAGDSATVMVVGADGAVAPRTVTLDGTVGDDWLVTGGLTAGDRVVVEGLMRARPGAMVHAVAWNQEQ